MFESESQIGGSVSHEGALAHVILFSSYLWSSLPLSPQEMKKSTQKGRTAGGFTERMAILETELAEAMESNQQLRK